MKKVSAFVTRGTPKPRPQHAPSKLEDEGALDEPEEVEEAATAASHPADLPRDLGTLPNGKAYIVRKLDRSIPKALSLLSTALEGAPDALLDMTLNQLLPGEKRATVTVIQFSPPVLTLRLNASAARFEIQRFVVPELQRALKPRFGFVRVQLI